LKKKQPTREIFTEPNVKENPEVSVTREQGFRENFLKYHESQNTKKFENFFDKIDFDILKGIFIEFIKEHEFDGDEINFLNRDRIFSMENLSTGGEFLPEKNAIILDEPEPKEFILVKENQFKQKQEEIIGAYGSWDIYRLKVTIHEEVHAISKNECVGLYNEDGTGRSEARFSQIGFHQAYNTIPQEGYYRPEFHVEWATHFFHALDEAITERVCRIITLKYLEKTKFDAVASEVYKKNLENNPSRLLHYQDEIDIISGIVKKVAIIHNKSEYEIWTKFEKGHLSGERFEGSELRHMLEKTFGDQFIEDLAWLWPANSNQRAFQKFEDKYDLSSD